jgi:polysaccharide biosynthesis protein PslA
LKKRISIGWYVAADLISAIISWWTFSFWRLQHITRFETLNIHSYQKHIYLLTLLVAAGWLLLYYISGAYRDIYQKSRLIEFLQTFVATIIGVFILFFFQILQDIPIHYTYYYKAFAILFLLQFGFTIFLRLLILNVANLQLEKGYIKYNTLIIGANTNAIQLYKDINAKKVGLGYHISGFIYANSFGKNGLINYLPNFGSITELEKIIDERAIEQVIVAIEKSEQHETEKIINRLSKKDVIVKVIPDMYDILSGSVRMNNVNSAVLIEIKPGLMPEWQQQLKRLIDITGSLGGLFLLSPLLMYIMIRVKLSSPGPVIYKQQRIGYKGKPFTIFKFRSMFRDAENNTPLLSFKGDPRITPWGKIMRQWRLDELPQLWNILKGEMSFVGPRPERKFFIEKIMEQNQYYTHLLKVKPGLTSWGMVKFGYAENVNQMIQRMQYDLVYLENISLAIDLKIMTYTLVTIFKKQGK